MHSGVARSRRTAMRQLSWTVGLGLALLSLLILATLSITPSAGAIISNTVVTPGPTSAANPGINIKFQAATSPGVSGYKADIGAVYGDRGNGYFYGWDRINTANTFDRSVNANELYDTGIKLHDNALATSGMASKWEIALPSGWYHLEIGAGDPSSFNAVYAMQAEGVTGLQGTPTSASRYVTYSPTVRVTDGRLTLTSDVGAFNNTLLWLRIVPRTTPAGRPLYFKTRINFQPITAARVKNYMLDSGKLYGDRGSGWTYGWNVDTSAWTVDRDSALSPDQRYDTLAHLRKDSVNYTWEIALPEGWYWVTIAGGDPLISSVARSSITAEGVQVIYQGADNTLSWLEGHAQVYVTDGKLTIGSSETTFTHTKINFIEISQGERDANNWGNLALGKKASQSSNQASYYAWRAVDGNGDGQLGNGSVAMTTSAAESFWEVDLGAVYYVDTVRLTPRNTYQARVADYYILTSEHPFTSTSLGATFSQPGVGVYPMPSALTAVTSMTTGRTARYIRIQLAGTNYLHLAEVEALGPLYPAIKWQASSSGSAQFAPAHYGIDQNTTSSWRASSRQKTGMYYKVDMRTAQTFSRLTFDSSTSTSYPRAFEVYVTNDSSVYNAPVPNYPSWGAPIYINTAPVNPVNITFPPQTARYLLIKLIAPADFEWTIRELTIAP
jgi:hypothetical protein